MERSGTPHRTPLHFLVAALATLALGAGGGVVSSSPAVAATAGGCASGMALKSHERVSRRGGHVRLTGHLCGASVSGLASTRVRIWVKRGRRWVGAANARLDSRGQFTTCAALRVKRRARFALLRAATSAGASRIIRVRVARAGKRRCAPAPVPLPEAPPEPEEASLPPLPGSDPAPQPDPGPGTTPEPEPEPGPTPPPEPAPQPPPPPCPLSDPGAEIGMTLPGCRTVLDDDARLADPKGTWGRIDCQTDSRHSRPDAGGDTSLRADGAEQGNQAHRRTTVFDGDDIWGERCELGRNDHRYGPTAIFKEGQRRVTYISIRLPSEFPLQVNTWQAVLQMKQTQPAAGGGGTPAIELDAYAGRWRLRQSDQVTVASDARELWSAPAETGTWTRFAFDVTYSQHSSIGRIRLHADLNGDGDFADGAERSPLFSTYTLKREIAGGGDDGIPEGASIPSHLRAGIYHNPSIACPTGCPVEIDNVQVMAP